MESTGLIGIWRIVSYELKTANGRVTRPFGSSPQGYIIYTAEGLMSVAIMPKWERQPTRQRDKVVNPYSVLSWLSWRRLRRLARFLFAATRYISYSGRYTVVEDTVIHHIDVSHLQSLIHTDQTREFHIHANSLVLVARICGTSQYFVWERVSGDRPADDLPEYDFSRQRIDIRPVNLRKHGIVKRRRITFADILAPIAGVVDSRSTAKGDRSHGLLLN